MAVVEAERDDVPLLAPRAVALGLLALRRRRSRLNLFEVLVVAVMFVGAVQAVRGVIWFALACAAILPAALDGLLTRADPAARRINLAILTASLAGLAVALVVTLARPADWFTQEWPDEQVEAVRAASRDPAARLWATDGTADWLLLADSGPPRPHRLRRPLRTLRRGGARYDHPVGGREGDWPAIVDEYGVAVVKYAAHLESVVPHAGLAVVLRDEEIVVVTRAPSGS